MPRKPVLDTAPSQIRLNPRGVALAFYSHWDKMVNIFCKNATIGTQFLTPRGFCRVDGVAFLEDHEGNLACSVDCVYSGGSQLVTEYNVVAFLD